VAVARKVSDQAAAAEIRAAMRLTTALPHTLALLDAGTMPVQRARSFLHELEAYDDELAGRLDSELAEQATRLPAWRIRQAVRRAAQLADPDSAAQRQASRTADRGVAFHADDDDQASVSLNGPAVPLTRWYATLDERARALRAAGDPRTLDNLRFDLAVAAFPCDSHPPTDNGGNQAGAEGPTGPAPDSTAPDPTAPDSTAPDSTAPAGLRLNGVEAAPIDCRRSRPVQAHIVVPVETALGLSNEPAWLDGYGWISAPTSRQLLIDAELRRICAQAGTGLIVDLDDRDRRPPPTPDGLRSALLDLVRGDDGDGRIALGDIGWRTEPQHDPSERLRDFVVLRDRHCDGPTGSSTPATRCDLDHARPYPDGPTAAWNLAARNRRTHQLKHYGWTPVRTTTGTVWISPSGQLVEVPRPTTAPPSHDCDPHLSPALPSAQQLAETDAHQLTARDDDRPPWPEPDGAPDRTPWTWLHQPLPQVADPAPF
jgi:predicted transcriptional regulator